MRLERVAISRWERGPKTFYATLTLRRSRGRAVEVDARPSDAINLAVRAGAPLFVAESVFQQAGVVPDGGAPAARDEEAP
jgi:bifunctional DNase/RNase